MLLSSFARSVLVAAALVAVGGCSSIFGSADATPRALPTPPPAAIDPAAVAFAEPLPEGTQLAPRVNIFGELDAKPRGPVRPVREAGFQQHSFIEEGYDTDVTVDRTGTWMAFASTRHNEQADIYLQRTDGQSVIQLTSDEFDDANPTFSPDGKQIAFASSRAGNWDIYVMDIDGKNAVSITSGPSQDVHPSFSPDGSRLVYSSLSPRTGQWEIWTVTLATGEKRMIGFGLFPSWSPDATTDRIAFQRARQRGSRWYSVWTLELENGEARRVTEVVASSNAACVSPTWSPDGKRIAFSTIVDPLALAAAANQPLSRDVWVIDNDGQNRTRITDGTGANVSPFWAQNNRIYFISDRSGAEQIWSARIDDGHKFAAAPAPRPNTTARSAAKKPAPHAAGHEQPAAGHATPAGNTTATACPATPADIFAAPNPAAALALPPNQPMAAGTPSTPATQPTDKPNSTANIHEHE